VVYDAQRGLIVTNNHVLEHANDITVTHPTPDVIRELKIPAPRGGTVIIKVDPRSPGARAGLKPGDIVTEIGDQSPPGRFRHPRGVRRATLNSAAPRTSAGAQVHSSYLCSRLSPQRTFLLRRLVRLTTGHQYGRREKVPEVTWLAAFLSSGIEQIWEEHVLDGEATLR
jgi:hypothetical protein